jgi:hypothetical protein
MYVILLLSHPVKTVGQSALSTFQEIIDSSSLVIVGLVVAESTLSSSSIDSVSTPGKYGINSEYDADIYFVKINRVLKGTSPDSVLKVIVILKEVMTTERVPMNFKKENKYLLFLNKKMISLELKTKYNLGSENYYTPTFEGEGVVSSNNSRQWLKSLEKTERYLGINHKRKKL